jgi:predicted O-linked N-acetylglucosamine transferase (SPINDLY family)
VCGLSRPEWRAETPAQFAERVVALCEDLPSLRAQKPDRQRQMLDSVLFDGVDLTHQVEEALLTMARWESSERDF